MKDALTVVTLDSATWFELHRDDAGFRAELHHPTKETSVGWVDKPLVAVGPTVEAAARALLQGPGSIWSGCSLC